MVETSDLEMMALTNKWSPAAWSHSLAGSCWSISVYCDYLLLPRQYIWAQPKIAFTVVKNISSDGPDPLIVNLCVCVCEEFASV